MNSDHLAKESLVLNMLEGWASSQNLTEGALRVFFAVVGPYPLVSVRVACLAFAAGEVEGRNNAYPPSSAELGAEVRRHLPADARDPNDSTDMRNLIAYPIGGKPPEGKVPAGLVSIDFGRGKIDLSRMTHAEQEATLRKQDAPERIRHDTIQRPALKRM
jgi:hypothetical protein